ncbi:hypothetical protein [Rhodohalobacter sp. 8-1]|uniref:hypothetical protein n=1 Tax=Rhodohalobacter sp. 8-1 TaxID=3131972 RepID=UPI0030ECE1A6
MAAIIDTGKDSLRLRFCVTTILNLNLPRIGSNYRYRERQNEAEVLRFNILNLNLLRIGSNYRYREKQGEAEVLCINILNLNLLRIGSDY